MEADSTTHDVTIKSFQVQTGIPFPTRPRNVKLYKKFIVDEKENKLPTQLTIRQLQEFGLIPKLVKCTKQTPNCNVEFKKARVVDRVQWVCACGVRQAIRIGSFFHKLPCSVVQALQVVLGWCEDADCEMVAQHFDVKPKLVSNIYDRMDELSIMELDKQQLGGDNSVVLVDMYPDCLNRLSPDTTDQPHGHRIIMLADTNYTPTRYRLHVIKEFSSKKMAKRNNNDQFLKSQLSEVISKIVAPKSTVVVGGELPLINGSIPLMQLLQHCDIDTQHFLTSRIWSQAVSLCLASRDLCSGKIATPACVASVQRYLNSSLYRIRFDDGFYEHTLRLIAKQFTKKEPNNIQAIINEININNEDISNTKDINVVPLVKKEIDETQNVVDSKVEVKEEIADGIVDSAEIVKKEYDEDVDMKTEMNETIFNINGQDIKPDIVHYSNYNLVNNDQNDNILKYEYSNNVIAIDEGNIVVPKVELTDDYDNDFIAVKNYQNERDCDMLSFGNDTSSVWNAQLSLGNEVLDLMDQKYVVDVQTISYDKY